MTLDSPLFRYARFRNVVGTTALTRISLLGIMIGLACLLYHGIVFLSEYVSLIPITLSTSTQFIGIALITTVLGMTGLQFAAFLNNKDRRVEHKQTPSEPPLSIEAARAILKASRRGENPFIQKLLIALSASPSIKEFFARLAIRIHDLKLPNEQPGSHEEVVRKAGEISLMHGHVQIRCSDLTVACFLTSTLLTQWYQQHDLSEADLARLSGWLENREQRVRQRARFWTLENLVNHPPIGLHWIYGFTRVLSSEALELTDWSHQFQSHRIVGRNNEVDQVESILLKGSNSNVLLVGQVGVGKKTVIEGCAERIRRGRSPLSGKRIFEISGEVFSSLREPDLMTLAREAARTGNIILAIPDVHLAVSNEESYQSKILQELLASNRVRVIATTDPRHYHEVLERNPALLRYTAKIDINEPTEEETRAILEEAIPEFESRHGIFFTFSGLESLIVDANKYLPNMPFPEKAMDMLESVGSWARSKKTPFITSQTINQIFSEMFHVPASVASDSERSTLLSLEDSMHNRVIGQDAAVTAIARSLQRIRSGIERKNKPIGSFLFLGPTGVGKTETAKTLAASYFGSESNLLRFDMSEFQNPEGVDRFIGSTQTNTPGIFVSKVRDNPFSVILLDEIEKAYHDLLNLFLQVLDEGFLTDAFGDKVSFTQSIIIATSNAGSEFIRELESGGQNPERNAERVTEHILHQGLFSPELLNRFDSVIVFHPLTRGQLTQVAELQLNSLVQQLKDKGFIFEPSKDLLSKVAEIGYDPQFGARPMARAIQNTVETLIAQKILAGTIQKGVPFTVSSEEIESFK